VRELVAERDRQLTRVQVLERRVAEARQLGNLELLAARYGFVRPRSSQLIIVAPEEGLLSRLFGGTEVAGRSGGSPEQSRGSIRSRDEVVVKNPAVNKRKRGRRRR